LITLPPTARFLFDLDGTLVNSSPLHDRAFREALAQRAPELLPVFDYEAAKGKTTSEAFRALGIANPGDVAELTRLKQGLFRALVKGGELEPIAGARELLSLLRAASHVLYLVTSGSRVSVTMTLEATTLAGSFAGIITSDEVQRGKPDPAPFLTCLRRFAIDPTSALAVEDAPNGITSAREAGLSVIGVNNQAVASLADLYFPTLNELAEWVIEQKERRGLVV
jgi:HAD superfamily hydrolase (TIGR01509 family)